MPDSSSIAIVAAQQAELVPFLRRHRGLRRIRRGGRSYWCGRSGGAELICAVTGEGRRLAAAGSKALLEQFEICRMIVVGLAGGLSSELPVGRLLLPTEVGLQSGVRSPLCGPGLERAQDLLSCSRGFLLTVDRLVTTSREKSLLHEQLAVGGHVAVDMESFDYVAAAQGARVEIVVIRTISDSFEDELPQWLNDCRRADGAIDRRRVVVRLATRPGSVAALMRMRRRLGDGAEQLARAVEVLLGV